MKFITTCLICFFVLQLTSAKDVVPLEIGSKAPNFNLIGVDDKMYTLENFRDADILVVLFTCNHCPTAQAYEDRIINFTDRYKNKNVELVAISPNAAEAVRFDELGYSEFGDSFEEMKIRSNDKQYNFPYLYDGDKQETATAFGAIATPHVFVFDKNRILKYQGRIDDDEHIGMAKTHDLENAVNEIISGTEVSKKTTKVFGCSLKWSDKIAWKLAEVEGWKKEKVVLQDASVVKIKELVANKEGENYRLINVWATWCGPCVSEFTSLIEIDHMYRSRGFELITLSADSKKAEPKVLEFLKNKTAGNNNYIFTGGNKYDMIEAIDPNWQGALPYTMLVNLDGEIVYTQMGMIDVLALKKAIVGQLGRYYD